MFPASKSYVIYPSVVLANTETTMTVAPAEKAFLLFDGVYNLTIIPVDGDTNDYHTDEGKIKLSAVAENGYLTFSFNFEGEQEYLVLLYRDEKLLETMHVYALESDLYERMPLKGDLHTHSYRSDGKRDPAALAGHFREQGFDFFALTDHNRYYPGGEIDETYEGIELGVTRVLGEEVHTPGSIVHIVHVGGKSSVTDLYYNHKDEYERELATYAEKVPASVPAQYRERYQKAMWATDKIHAAGGLAIFAHPYWRPAGSSIRNVRDEFAKILLKSGMFDAYELMGGMGQDGNNRSIALWSDLRADGLKISVVASSDVHALEGNYFNYLFNICFAKAKENDAIVDAVKNGYCVAVEATGEGKNRHYRVYGSLRLVSYAQFLLKYYFHELQRVCQGEGIAMRSYAMDNAPAALIELQVAQTKDFTDRYFGRKAPLLPSKKIIEFEEKWRARHLEGPLTKGSSVFSEKITRQI